MSRVQARHRVIAVVALTLTLAGAPAVWAAPLSQTPATTVGAANWLDSAAAWFGGLLDLFAGITPTGKAPKGPDSATSPAIIIIDGGGGGHINTGSCIDPLGGNKCNY